MSGPKVDIARLREQEKRKLIEARQRRKSLIEQMRKHLGYIQNGIKIPSDVPAALSDVYSKLSDIIKVYSQRLSELMNKVCEGNELLDCDSCLAELNKLMQEFESLRSPLVVELNALVESSAELAQSDADAQRIASFKKEKIHSGKSQPQTVAETSKEATFEELFESLEEGIREFISTPEITSSKKNSVLSLRRDIQELADSKIDERRKIIRLGHMQEDFEKIKELALAELSEMSELYEKYLLEYFDSPLPKKKLSDFSSKQELLDAIKIADTLAAEGLSGEYIRRQINEVMAKHGYDILRSDVLASTEESGQILYGVDDKTAINVFVSNDNQVTMRVVGIGFDESISAEEDQELFEQQCAFCSLHPQITAELKMRGVILETRKHLPPDRKYNKKIVTRTKPASGTSSKAKKNLKRSGPKALHKE